MQKSLLFKRLLGYGLLAFAAVSVVVLIIKDVRGGGAAQQGPPAPARQVSVHYFHGMARCETCRKIERLTGEVLQRNFAAELKDGRLAWRVANREEAETAALVTELQVGINCVIVADRRHGQLASAKRLDNVWILVGREAEFDDYLKTEVRAVLERP